MSSAPLHVAIIGGGLCGLTLAIALTKRSISHTIYKSHSSFTEIGAGLNLGPNALEAFRLIDPEISDEVFSFATRNPGRKEDLWMSLRLGAPTDEYDDAAFLHEIRTVPSKLGSTTVSRNGLLQFLAERTRPENAKFNKKLVDLSQSDEKVTMSFADGTAETADVVIACDGIHSTGRRILCGPDNPAAKATFTGHGVYRAVFPMEQFEQIVGKEQSQVSTLRLGPDGYAITYPIDGGKNMNVGLWGPRDGWQEKDWIIPNQKPAMLRDHEGWGPTIHKIMDAMSDEAAFWATHEYSITPGSYFKGRMCVIGDAAHAMTPHQGQGASQAMEDACVIAEVLQAIDSTAPYPQAQQIEAAFTGYEAVRKERFEKVMRTSHKAMAFWGSLWRPDLKEDDVKAFNKAADDRFPWMWQPDIEGQGRRALEEMKKVLASPNGSL